MRPEAVKEKPTVIVQTKPIWTKCYNELVTVCSMSYKVKYNISGNRAVNALFNNLVVRTLVKKFPLTNKVKGKAALSGSDKFDEEVGISIATSRARIKAYEHILKQLRYVQEYLLKIVGSIDDTCTSIEDDMQNEKDSINSYR